MTDSYLNTMQFGRLMLTRGEMYAHWVEPPKDFVDALRRHCNNPGLSAAMLYAVRHTETPEGGLVVGGPATTRWRAVRTWYLAGMDVWGFPDGTLVPALCPIDELATIDGKPLVGTDIMDPRKRKESIIRARVGLTQSAHEMAVNMRAQIMDGRRRRHNDINAVARSRNWQSRSMMAETRLPGRTRAERIRAESAREHYTEAMERRATAIPDAIIARAGGR